MKKPSSVFTYAFGVCGMLWLCLSFQGCREDLTGEWPVIQEELVGEYLENHPENFSEFTRMLDTTGVMGLLKTYGMYTVFAPTNEAIERYYTFLSADKGETITSLNQLSIPEIREFCYNHIIKGDTLRTKDFRVGTLGCRSMSQRFYTVSISDSTIIINGNSLIIARDIKRHNGIIHVLGEALSPANAAIGEVFEKDSARFGIYVEALKATDLYKIMNTSRIEDEGYDEHTAKPYIDNYNNNTVLKPISRKFGYTILAVSDADLATYVTPGSPTGVHSLADLAALAKYYYSREFNNDADTITDKTNPKHYLNRFMSYHCFDRILLSSRFIKDLFTPSQLPEFPMPEYIETMLENTIVEVLLDKPGTIIGPTLAANPKSVYGVFNVDDPMQAVLLTDLMDLPYGGSLNGYYHGITKPLLYSNTLEEALASKRLRIDAASFFSELTTNNLRGSNPTGAVNGKQHSWEIDDTYVDNYSGYPNTRLFYIDVSSFWPSYQGDGFRIVGPYHFTIKTCPIPAGTYEVRVASILGTNTYGTVQLYFDSVPCGIPYNNYEYWDINRINLGYVQPGTDPFDPMGYENDKMMRNLGFMKGPNSYCGPSTSYIVISSARMAAALSRKILGTYTFDKTESHYFTAIFVGGSLYWSNDVVSSFMFDYLEFCPVSLIDKEGID